MSFLCHFYVISMSFVNFATFRHISPHLASVQRVQVAILWAPASLAASVTFGGSLLSHWNIDIAW